MKFEETILSLTPKNQLKVERINLYPAERRINLFDESFPCENYKCNTLTDLKCKRSLVLVKIIFNTHFSFNNLYFKLIQIEGFIGLEENF